jgi:tetrahydromethanopterin S-methyltransferase subunit G
MRFFYDVEEIDASNIFTNYEAPIIGKAINKQRGVLYGILLVHILFVSLTALDRREVQMRDQ